MMCSSPPPRRRPAPHANDTAAAENDTAGCMHSLLAQSQVIALHVLNMVVDQAAQLLHDVTAQKAEMCRTARALMSSHSGDTTNTADVREMLYVLVALEADVRALHDKCTVSCLTA